MKTATVRDLRNDFPKLEAWMGEGEQIEIRKRGRLIARLVPMVQARQRKPAKPDIMARLAQRWGAKSFSAAEVKAMRAAELAGEEG